MVRFRHRSDVSLRPGSPPVHRFQASVRTGGGRIQLRRRHLLIPCLVLVPLLALLLQSAPPTASRVDPAASSRPAADAAPSRADGAGAPASVPAAARAVPTLAPSPLPPQRLHGYVWPLATPRVTLPFGPSIWGEFFVDGQRVHDGVDMASFCGDRVVAAHDGVVLAAGRRFDNFMGWVGDLTGYYYYLESKNRWNDLPIVIVVDDGNGYRSMYAHFSSVVVKAGETVRAGQLIGYEGMTGHATGCHVHYGLFSPLADQAWLLDPAVASKMSLPPAETARINPLLVLPYRHDVAEMQSLRPAEAAAWTPPPATPKPAATRPVATSPKPSPTPKR